MSPEEVEKIIEQLITLVGENYILEERLPAIKKHLRKGIRRGDYNRLGGNRQLSDKLTEDLRTASSDLHFGVRLRPAPMPACTIPQEKLSERVDTDTGLGRVALLAGNVGYLEIKAFVDPHVGAAAADAAFQHLADSDALLVDVRHSRGGTPEMVAYLFSYFFDGEPFLFNSFHWRNQSKTLEFWTRNDLGSSRYVGRDVYILISPQTPSAAEGFSYHLQNFRRAMLIGQRTAGAAHTYEVFPLGALEVAIPTGQPISPVSGANWEGTGVEPDFGVAAEQALDVAHRLALKRLLEKSRDPATKARLEKALGTLGQAGS